MKFTEEKLENAFTELLGNENFPHNLGITINRLLALFMPFFKNLCILQLLPMR